MTDRKNSDQYLNDIKRLEDRVNLVVGSLVGAHGVDQHDVVSASVSLRTAFLLLKDAVK